VPEQSRLAASRERCEAASTYSNERSLTTSASNARLNGSDDELRESVLVLTAEYVYYACCLPMKFNEG
jgi:hypothetical protein